MQLSGNKLYFADGENGYKLSSVSKTATNVTNATLVYDHKINNLYHCDGELFFTVNNLLGDYLAKYIISTGAIKKLTSDAAGSIAFYNNEVYYTNVDKINSSLFGKGIYKVNQNPISDNNLPGNKVVNDVESDYELTSINIMNGNLYFYRVYDKSIYCYDFSKDSLINLLDGFTVPETNVILSSGISELYGDKLYYKNVYDGNKLYCYDTISEINTRVTSTAIDDIYIYRDLLYYRQVTMFVNKDLYCIDLKQSLPPTLISKDDCGELEVYEDKIYYVNYSGKNEVCRMNLDGTGNEVLYEGNAYQIRVYNDKLYFVENSGIYSNGWIYQLDLNNSSTTEDKKVKKLENCRTSYYEIYQNRIYFRHMSGIGYTNKNLSSCDLNGENLITLVSDSCDPVSFSIENNIVYYYNDVIGNPGLFSYNISTNKTEQINTDYASQVKYNNGKIYYYNSASKATLGDSHLYELNLNTKQKRRIDIL